MELKRHLVTNEVVGIAFTFYTGDEVRKISVKQISNPVMFDTLGNPQDGGLYDPALGPTDKMSSCKSCSLVYADCPGHLGHVELMVPVYNPLLFNLLYKLLRSTCLNCHHFKMASERVEVFRKKLVLIAAEAPSLAFEVERKYFTRKARQVMAKQRESESKRKGSKSMVDDEAEEAPAEEEDEHSHQNEEESDEEGNLSPDAQTSDFWKEKTTQSTELLSETIKEFLRSMTSLHKCENCGAHALTLRKDKATKIFVAHNEKVDKANKALGLNILGVDDEKSKKQKKEKDEKENKKKKKKNESDSDSAEEREEEKENEDSDVEEGDEDEDEEKKKQKSLKEKDDTNANEFKKPKKAKAADMKKFLTPIDVRSHVLKLWEIEREMIAVIFAGIHTEKGHSASRSIRDPSIFFFETIPVTPPKFRPLSDTQQEHPQTIHYSNILRLNAQIRQFGSGKEQQQSSTSPQKQQMSSYTSPAFPPPDSLSQMLAAWIELQQSINFLLDNKDALPGSKVPAGITQILEKKQGMFRKHMMGKRVNYAARSVIAPDVNLETNQIGVPSYFAKTLTYPQPVTPFNYTELAAAVIRGPSKHPGANAIEDEFGNKVLLKADDEQSRIAIAKTLQLTSNNTPKKVYRHLKDGDPLLVNRQPTLHKPGIMAHIAKVLGTEKTIRMHYANCATYNADFDGDEMNLHLPQNELARAEAYEICLTDEQYIGPREGNPLRGLIQDHICTGVLLTKKDAFLTREQLQQIVYGACHSVNTKVPLKVPPPCILKPRQMWSGKQAVSMVLQHCSHGFLPMNMESTAKIPGKLWHEDPDKLSKSGIAVNEGQVIVRTGDLVVGVLDKNQFGASPHGLVHAAYELYSPTVAGTLLGALGRLFTAYLQIRGFTCTMEDLLLNEKAEQDRVSLIHKSVTVGQEAACKQTQVTDVKDAEFGAAMQTLTRAPLEKEKFDMAVKSEVGKITSGIIEKCIGDGQRRLFPANHISIMTESGAKGGKVNHSQISTVLGQQELEGQRPAVMVSGKTLPSFVPYDPSARAGGYISDRFLTGLRPQEYFFHAMAGRIGLIDTAVKTSRSGYLQRCLIKQLESLRVNYDNTVRDSDGSVVQFQYGEDAIDVTKSAYLDRFNFLAANFDVVAKKHDLSQNVSEKNAKRFDTSAAEELLQKSAGAASSSSSSSSSVDPILTKLSPATHLGSVSEKYRAQLEKFISDNADLFAPDGESASVKKKEKKQSQQQKRKKDSRPTRSEFRRLMFLKYQQSLAHPGEAVGLLAAQSIGEPSTQMTLNTFHHAGRGESNVTLGIPRMREILMTAGASIKTPIMKIKLRKEKTKADAELLQRKLKMVVFADVYTNVTIKEGLMQKAPGMPREKVYRIAIDFLKTADDFKQYDLSWDEVKDAVECRFISALCSVIQRALKMKKAAKSQIGAESVRTPSARGGAGEGDVEGGNGGKRQRKAHRDEEDAGDTRAGGEYDDADADEQAILARGEEVAQKRARRAAQSDDALAAEDEAEAEQKKNAEEEGEAEGERAVGGGGAEGDEAEKLMEEDESARKDALKRRFPILEDYRFSKSAHTLELTISIPAYSKKLLMINLFDSAATKFIVRSVRGIRNCYVLAAEKKDEPCAIQTDGVNFADMWQFSDILDLRTLETNDILSALRFYGVEVARSLLIKEIAGVFQAYNIKVNRRHLDLVADYMSFEGDVKPFNRIGIASSPSPLLKMSFETTMQFMTDACARGDYDTLQSPAARIVLGLPVLNGTGSFEVLQRF